MTLDELKAESKAQGYKLMPITPYIKLSPCKCGRKRIKQCFMKFDGCPNCGARMDGGEP